MASVRSILDCIGVDTSENVSVLLHLYGFLRQRVPTDPDNTVTAEVSLLDQVRSLQGDHVHLNVIKVGVDNFTDAEVDKIEYAIYKTRNIYNTRSLGVGRVKHYDVTAAESGGTNDLGSEDEAEDLTHDWSVDNDGLDIFVVENISDPDYIGLSPVDGPCDKDDKDMNGAIGGEVGRGAEGFARTFAHEAGHYLGLSHQNSQTDNLMCQTKFASSTRDSVVLTSSQGSTIRGHCSVQSGC